MISCETDIHNAQAGSSGAVVVALDATTSFFSGQTTINDPTDLNNNNYYFNIHTSAFSAGEIRGQITRFIYRGAKPEIKSTVLLGGNSIPVVTDTNAFGLGFSFYNRLSRNFTYYAWHNISDATLAHIHNGTAFENGPVVISLNPKYIRGWQIISSETDYLNGNWYFNVHGNPNSRGVVRGQLNAPATHVAFLESTQQSPAVASQYSGLCSASYNAASKQLTINCAHNIPTVTSAHLHNAAIGSSGAIVFSIPLPSLLPIIYTFPQFSDAQETELLAGRMYLNFHTTANPSGELRGQLLETEYSLGMMQPNPTVSPTSSTKKNTAGTSVGKETAIVAMIVFAFTLLFLL